MRLEPSLAPLFPTRRVALDVNRRRAMEDSIEDSCGNDHVAEYFVLLVAAEGGSQDHFLIIRPDFLGKTILP